MRRTVRALSVAVLTGAAFGATGTAVAAADPAAEVSPGSARPGATVIVSVTCEKADARGSVPGAGQAPSAIDATSSAFAGRTVRLARVEQGGGLSYRGTAQVVSADGPASYAEGDAAAGDVTGGAPDAGPDGTRSVDGTCPTASGARGRAWSTRLAVTRDDAGPASVGDGGAALPGDAGPASVGDGGAALQGGGGAMPQVGGGAMPQVGGGALPQVGGGAASQGDGGTVPHGDVGAVTGGDYDAVTGGDYDAVTGGDFGAASRGDDGMFTRGDQGTAARGDDGGAPRGDDDAASRGDVGAASRGDDDAASRGDGHAVDSRGEDGDVPRGNGERPCAGGQQECGGGDRQECGGGAHGGDGSCAVAGVQHGVEAGDGGAYSPSVPALFAGGMLIAAACCGAAYRVWGGRPYRLWSGRSRADG
ncbi:hypothetical protein ACFWPQ_39235 [Streptomyces sp. NPDC058464]|uniref:hypothetical protein n=1 Tax=Streptomyces sp. NPDC058464 TaxID=3346511 RepID=UPI0036490725